MVSTKNTTRTLNVLMNGIAVGLLKKTVDNQLNFRYTQSWLDTPGARPISLSLPLLDRPFKGHVVFNFFDNLLPDNPKVRARIQAQFKTRSNHPFDLLAEVGKECAGAIQLIPGRIPAISHKIRFEPLKEPDIAKRLSEVETHPLGMSPGLDAFRLTLSGSKEKAAFLYHNNTWARPRDKTPSTHIFKLAHANDDGACENTWLCLQIAKAFGLPTPDAHLMTFKDTQALVIKRYDRQYSKDNRWIMRIPQETLCQALGMPSANKYSSMKMKRVMKLLLGSDNPIYDRDLFFCIYVLCWLLNSTSLHLKSLSILIRPEGKYRLAPFYNLTSSYPDNPSHVPKKLNYLQLAKSSNYSVERATAIFHDMISRLDTVIEEVRATLPPYFSRQISDSILNGMIHAKNQMVKASSTPEAATLPS